jgi:hypothetical protein
MSHSDKSKIRKRKYLSHLSQNKYKLNIIQILCNWQYTVQIYSQLTALVLIIPQYPKRGP